MGGQDTAYIFHLYRSDGESLVLHPFDTGERLLSRIESGDVLGRYGEDPRVEALTALRAELHRLADRGVQSWLADLRFVPKFLAAAGIFLVVYFFFSFVVRDPLPVLDEVAAGIGTAVLVFILMGRADLRSERARRKQADLRAAVDRVTFVESTFVRSVEQALREGESGSLVEWVEVMNASDRWGAIGAENAAEARSFVETVESRYGVRGGRREERSLRRLLRKRDGSRERLDRWARARKIDVPLYTVYHRIKRSVVAGSSA